MANNRMYLICNVCHPEVPAEFIVTQITPESGAIAIAKWYPGGMNEEGAPYYSNRSSEQLGDDILEFLDMHKHGEVASEKYLKGAGQENPVRLEYETEGLPKLN
jgi:hypothetical protein